MVDQPPVDKPPPSAEEIEIDPRLSPAAQEKIIEAEVRNAKAGRLVGFVVIVLGVILTLLGVTGAVNLNLSGLGLTAKVTNAAPGIVLMIIGLFIIWRTNLRITAARNKK